MEYYKTCALISQTHALLSLSISYVVNGFILKYDGNVLQKKPQFSIFTAILPFIVIMSYDCIT